MPYVVDVDEARELTLAQPRAMHVHPLDSEYARRLWLPTLGPTTFILLQLINDGAGTTTTVRAIFEQMGIRQPERMSKTLARAHGFHVAWASPGKLFGLHQLTDLRDTQLAHLPKSVLEVAR